MRKILVIGGGIGGLSAAIALQRQGFDAHVYEAVVRPGPVGKGIWMPINAMRVLERLGLADAVAQSGVPLECVELRDRADGLLLRLDLQPLRAAYGHTMVSIHRAALYRVLTEHLPPDTLHLGRRCTGFVQDERCVAAHIRNTPTWVSRRRSEWLYELNY